MGNPAAMGMKMKVICSICSRHYDDKEGYGISHGYCPPCARAVQDTLNGKARYMKYWQNEYYGYALIHVGTLSNGKIRELERQYPFHELEK